MPELLLPACFFRVLPASSDLLNKIMCSRFKARCLGFAVRECKQMMRVVWLCALLYIRSCYFVLFAGAFGQIQAAVNISTRLDVIRIQGFGHLGVNRRSIQAIVLTVYDFKSGYTG